jgi:enoyl-[acyl-carrier protein] reductase II
MKVIAVVPSVSVAVKSRDLGVDAIIAEGSESGGMQGFKGASTMVLVPAVVDAVNIPVAAAGGIGDYRGFRAALALGAQGVQVGTRFIASMECVAHANYKTAIMDADETGTDLVNLGAFQVRALKTPLAMDLMAMGPQSLDGFSGIGLEQAWVKGDLQAGILPAGQVSGLIREVPTVGKIIQDMVRDWPNISL